MFQVNKEKFDVSSTYDEEMAQYTWDATIQCNVPPFLSSLVNFPSPPLFSECCWCPPPALLSVDILWSVSFCLSLSLSLSLSFSTKLERDDTENFRQREARAARIAQEIEAKDKKRFDIDDTGTEEELYDPSSTYLILFIFSLLSLSLTLSLSLFLMYTDSVQ